MKIKKELHIETVAELGREQYSHSVSHFMQHGSYLIP
jgi:hypothetical protein